MSFAELLTRWNRWYDRVPDMWRFQLVVWALLLVGTINMMLTVSRGFPFGLLVLLAIAALAAVRLPYVRGWFAPADSVQPVRTSQVEGPDWFLDINRRYEAMPDNQRVWVYPAVLLVAGAINMMLTISHGFPFGLLFLLALLGLVLVRAPYTAGQWVTPRAVADLHEPPVDHPLEYPLEPATVAPGSVALDPTVPETEVPTPVETRPPSLPVADPGPEPTAAAADPQLPVSEPDPKPPAAEAYGAPVRVPEATANPAQADGHSTPPPVSASDPHPEPD